MQKSDQASLYQAFPNERQRLEFLHDLANAQVTLIACVRALQGGYRFEDASAAERIQALEKTSATVTTAARLLQDILK